MSIFPFMNIEDIESSIENSIDELPMYYEVGWD